MLAACENWKKAYPGALVGALAMRGAANPPASAALDAQKEALEALLRDRYGPLSRNDLKALPVLRPYTDYYRDFGKTYHVQLQLESLVFKGKAIPRVAGLVEAMFMAELKNLLLTAGHDLDAIQGRVVVDVAVGSESYVPFGGEPRALKPGDMFIRDEAGVLSSVIYGPADRAQIAPATTRVLFTVYAPPGIAVEQMRDHLNDLSDNVRIVAPRAEVEAMEVIGAGWVADDRPPPMADGTNL
jgi:DNA/RNA-binding domain of Phe-tRNA-synthetase-like protein